MISGIADRVQRLRRALHSLNSVFCLRDPLSKALDADLTPPQVHTIVAEQIPALRG